MDTFKVISLWSSQFVSPCQSSAWRGYKCFSSGAGSSLLGVWILCLADSEKSKFWWSRAPLPAWEVFCLFICGRKHRELDVLSKILQRLAAMVATTKSAAGQLTFLAAHQKRRKVKCCLPSEKMTSKRCPVLSSLTSRQPHGLWRTDSRRDGVRNPGCGAQHRPSTLPDCRFRGGTLSRGSGGHFAAAASAAPQQLNPPADMQVSPRLCSQACRKSLLLAVCLSELITPAPGSSPRRSGSLRGLGVQGHGHGGGETQPLATGVTLPRLPHLFRLLLWRCHPAVTLGAGRACVRAEILQSALKAAV